MAAPPAPPGLETRADELLLFLSGKRDIGSVPTDPERKTKSRVVAAFNPSKVLGNSNGISMEYQPRLLNHSQDGVASLMSSHGSDG